MLKRKRRLLRLHLDGGKPSIEGVFLGFEAGHYRLAAARQLQAADGGRVEETALTGEAWVPRGRVLYAQKVG